MDRSIDQKGVFFSIPNILTRGPQKRQQINYIKTEMNPSLD